MNLGFIPKLTSSLFQQFVRTNIKEAETYVECYDKSLVELRFARKFEYGKVPLSWYSSGLRALFRHDDMVMQLIIITLPSIFSFLFFSLWSRAPFPNYQFSF